MNWSYLVIVIVPGLMLGLWAQWRVKSAFARASRMHSRRGLTGAQVAQEILDGAGITDVRIEPHQGVLSDHYHPSKKALRLSEPVYGQATLAAAGVAAHEVGHALQHAKGYWPLAVRSALVPACVAGQWIGQIAMLVGCFFAFGFRTPFGQWMLLAAIAGYGLVFLFTLVTLPVEFDASARAVRILGDRGILDPDELGEAKAVLDAAAWTYVASAVQVLLVLIWLLMQLNRRR